MPDLSNSCRLCDRSFSDRKTFGRHLWEEHRLTPDQYRVQVLGIGPKCCNPKCNNPVQRSTEGGWHKACSPFCAIAMGVDIPLSLGSSGTRAKIVLPRMVDVSTSVGAVVGGFALGALALWDPPKDIDNRWLFALGVAWVGACIGGIGSMLLSYLVHRCLKAPILAAVVICLAVAAGLWCWYSR